MSNSAFTYSRTFNLRHSKLVEKTISKKLDKNDSHLAKVAILPSPAPFCNEESISVFESSKGSFSISGFVFARVEQSFCISKFIQVLKPTSRTSITAISEPPIARSKAWWNIIKYSIVSMKAKI